MAQWLSNERWGNGADGALNITEDTTEVPIDSSCSGSAAGTELSATNASFEANQIVLIHQLRGTGAGQWELNVISGYVEGTITTKYDLTYTYTDDGDSQAQVRVLKQYSSVTIANTKNYTSKAWDANVGGIIGWMCNGITTVTGNVIADTKGFLGGSDQTAPGGSGYIGYTGEGTGGARNTRQQAANGSGGGGGTFSGSSEGGGAGGGHAAAGTAGNDDNGGKGGVAGEAKGSADLTTMVFGGGGGGGGTTNTSNSGGGGGNSGGMVAIFSNDIVITGTISSDGGDGDTSGHSDIAGGGGGSGGAVLIKANTAILGANLIDVVVGDGGAGAAAANGGPGAVGRIALHYGTSYTGSSTPSLDATLDNDLRPVGGNVVLMSGGVCAG